MKSIKVKEIQSLLERAHADFHQGFHRARDPIELVHQYARREDQEVVALITALLSYGNVTTIQNSVRAILLILGERPAEAIREQNYRGKLDSFRHRFTTGLDIEILLAWIAGALKETPDLETFFVSASSTTSNEMKDRLSAFVARFTSQPLPNDLFRKVRSRDRNLKYLISDPARGSACKRLNMFLRWVARPRDGIDLGIWKKLGTEQLMLPLDTHLLKTIKLLKWTKSNQANWKVVEEATEKLRGFDAKDPIRFDFALCHLSMTGKSLLMYKKMEIKYSDVSTLPSKK